MRRPSPLRGALLVLLAAALGCGTPSLDSSNLEKSAARMRKGVERSRRADFDLALKTVESASRGEIEGTQPFALDGMTAEAVFAEAEKVGLRRELVWVERTVAGERQLVDARVYLDRLRLRAFAATRSKDGQVYASFEVENRLDTAVDTAWLRIDAPRWDGGTLGGEDLVDFQPRLEPGERRNIQIQVTSEASRVLVEEPSTRVVTRFTLVGLGGNTLFQEPAPEALENASRRLAEEERHRDQLRAKLAG